MKEMEIGSSAQASAYVHETMLASRVESGSLDVLATPMMGALMEKAACLLVGNALEDEETSVGVELNITHTAPTSAGGLVTATAELTAVEGRTLIFKVSAKDDAGEIGGGTHKRVVVNTEAFLEKAKARQAHDA